MDVIKVTDKPIFDETLTYEQYHTHLPYASTTYNNNDEIRIPIHQQDVYTLPCKSFLHIEGKLTKKAHADVKPIGVKFSNNAGAFLFEEIRYEINGIEVNRVQKLGIASTMKNILSVRANESNILENAGWMFSNDFTIEDDGSFKFHIPLRMLLGFAEDYKRIILNVKQELILLRSSNDLNALTTVTGSDSYDLKITKVSWKIPYIHVADTARLHLLKVVEQDKPLAIPFRSWEIHEYPVLPQTTTHSWTVKTSSQMEKPRFVILALQTGRKDDTNKNASHFDMCDMNNLRLYLNSQYYPYDNLQGDVSIMYEMFVRFQSVYYDREDECPAYSLSDYKKKVPLFVIDCSRQSEVLKTGAVDVRLEFETKKNIPAHTTAYCLLIYDTIVQYTPLTGLVKKMM